MLSGRSNAFTHTHICLEFVLFLCGKHNVIPLVNGHGIELEIFPLQTTKLDKMYCRLFIQTKRMRIASTYGSFSQFCCYGICHSIVIAFTVSKNGGLVAMANENVLSVCENHNGKILFFSVMEFLTFILRRFRAVTMAYPIFSGVVQMPVR